MEIMSAAGGPVAVAEVAAGIGADRSTAYRMLLTLAEAGYADQAHLTREATALAGTPTQTKCATAESPPRT